MKIAFSRLITFVFRRLRAVKLSSNGSLYNYISKLIGRLKYADFIPKRSYLESYLGDFIMNIFSWFRAIEFILNGSYLNDYIIFEFSRLRVTVFISIRLCLDLDQIVFGFSRWIILVFGKFKITKFISNRSCLTDYKSRIFSRLRAEKMILNGPLKNRIWNSYISKLISNGL